MSKTLTTDLSLFDFAYCGDRRAFTENSLINLSSLAETENWDGPGQKGNYDVLFYYIVKTWEIVASQGKISCTDEEDLALFNTGLLTENGEEIYGCIQPNTRAESNPKAQKWFFKGFYKESTRFLSDYIFEKPEIARYDNNLAEFHFDMDTPIEFNADHIFDDHWDDDVDRFPKEIKQLGRGLAAAAILSAFEVTKKKLKRNPRLAVPQYYNGKVMFLLPISIATLDDRRITMALGVEKTSNGLYRANTIFDLQTAYKKARLIMRPESNWLCK